MNLLRRIAENTLWVAAARILGKVCSLGVVLLLARYLGAEEFGKYALVTAYLALFAILTDMGMDMILVREASKDLKGSESLVGSAIVLKGIIAPTVLGVALFVAWLLGYDSEKLLYLAIAGAGFLLAPFTCYSSAFFSTLELRLPSMLEVASKLLTLLAVVLLLLAGTGLAAMFLAMFLIAAVEALVKMGYARRYFKPRLRPDPALWKYLLKEAWPLAVVLIPILLVQRIDQVMLEGLRGDTELGFYSAAVRLCEGFLILPVAVLSSLYPLLSRYYTENRATFEETCRIGFKYFSIMGTALFFLLLVFSGPAVTLLFGQPFAPSGLPLGILSGTLVFLFGGFLYGTLFVITGHQKSLILMMAMGTGLNILLNLFWIPPFGAAGAAAATLLSYALTGLGLGCYPSMRSYGWLFLKSHLRPLLAGTLGLLLSFKLFPGPSLGLFLSFVVLYTLFLLLCGTFGAQDWRLLRKFVLPEKQSDQV